MDKKQELTETGFTVIENIYNNEEIEQMITVIVEADEKGKSHKETFRKSSDLFAIRQLLKEVPQLLSTVFNNKLRTIIHQHLGPDYFVVKSIYFDKPDTSNWYVPYHQDLTISVDKKIEIENYGPWTVKQNQYAVQPPINILENIVTIRIHLDDTDENNGSLRVLSTSHLNGVQRTEEINREELKESVCSVKRGGVMLMKPLLLHRSCKTTNKKRRRVINIEFSCHELASPLQWAEKMIVPKMALSES